MSTGSQADMLSRIKSVLPGGWFPLTGQDAGASATPVLDAALSGAAWALTWFWQFLTYVTTQARIATASGINLDMVAADFFGSGLARRSGEADSAFRARILAALFPKQGTRQAVVEAASAASGGRAVVFEPGYALDAGGWDIGTTGFDTARSAGWGTRLMPFQAFLTTLPADTATVYAAVERARPVGTIIWTRTSLIAADNSGSDEDIPMPNVYITALGTDASSATVLVTGQMNIINGASNSEAGVLIGVGANASYSVFNATTLVIPIYAPLPVGGVNRTINGLSAVSILPGAELVVRTVDGVVFLVAV